MILSAFRNQMIQRQIGKTGSGSVLRRVPDQHYPNIAPILVSSRQAPAGLPYFLYPKTPDMKHVLLLLCCCFYTGLLAQTDTTEPVSKDDTYVFGTFQFGLPVTAQLGLEVILPSELSLGVFVSGSNRDSPNKPYDYQVVNFIGSDDDRVGEGLALGILTVGKSWWVSDDYNTRFNLKAGPLLGVFFNAGKLCERRCSVL